VAIFDLRCGTTNWPHLLSDSWPLNMGLTGRPATSVNNYHYTLRNFSEQRRSHILCGGTPKTCISNILLHTAYYTAIRFDFFKQPLTVTVNYLKFDSLEAYAVRKVPHFLTVTTPRSPLPTCAPDGHLQVR